MRAWPLLAVCLLAAPVAAQQGPPPAETEREADMFGGPDPTEPTTTPEQQREQDIFGEPEAPVDEPVAPSADTDRERNLFGGGDEPAISHTSLLSLEEDILAIGGQVYLRLVHNIQEGEDFEDNPLSMPNLVDLYFDARPNDRVRAFVSGRLKYDPTIDPDAPGAFGQPAPDNPDILLDQLWLKFDVARAMWVTLGKQPIRWGTARLWNPVDVVNASRRDPLAFFDERTGVTLAKLHFPVESLGWNFYVVGLFDDGDSLDKIGAAVRGEFVFSTVEMSVSGMIQKDRKPRVGFDFSAGVWDFDIYGEVGVSFGSDLAVYEGKLDILNLVLPTEVDLGDQAIPQVTAGLNYAVTYSDEDSLYIGAEYFFNDKGYDDEGLYPYLIYQGAFQPFYLGQHYAALYLLLPAPGRWDDTSFTLSGIGNLSDVSFLSRLDFTITVLTYLEIQSYVAVHAGTKGGEYRFAADIPAINIPGQVAFPGVEVKPQMVDIGLNFRVSI